ncbi:hypothetical protein WA026_002840 [Henosepilachna vigintioctopunctata]|uniref:Uncharacterized protein n=1 Tax=Henosepilachna vigintioctopunctata TaxID=420089 RepID=A0AAW1U2U7_9CUCU
MDDYRRIDNSFNSLRKRRSVMKILRNSTHGINLRDKNGWTVLLCVANLGNMSYTRKPLRMEADVNAISSNGFTPLHLACMSRHEECMDIILNYGPSMNIQHSKYCTPFHLYFLSGMQNERLLKKMLSKGADPNIQDKSGNTALHLLANRNSLEKMKEFARLLIEYDEDLNAINEEGETPVHTAVNANCGLLVDVLIKEGAEVDLDMLHYIIGYEGFMNFKINCADELSKLKQKKIHNCTISYYDILIASPHKVAKCLGNDDILQALIIFDENMDGNTALHLLAFRKHTEKMEEFVRLLMEYDADINAINEEGHTPVHAAVNVSCGVLVNVLLQEGADVNIEGNRGNTPITKAFSVPLSSADILMNLEKHLVMQYECNFQVEVDMLNYIIEYEDFMIFKIKCGDELLNLKQKMIHNSTIGLYDTVFHIRLNFWAREGKLNLTNVPK